MGYGVKGRASEQDDENVAETERLWLYDSVNEFNATGFYT